MKKLMLPCAALLLLVPTWLRAAEAAMPQSVLADYVAQPDDSYRWVERRKGDVAGGQFVELILTSQTWHDIVWKHQVYLIKPANVDFGHQALLLVDGGSWKDSLAEPAKPGEGFVNEAVILANVAREAKGIVVIVRQVPHQPILGGKKEDDAISYTFEQYVRTGDNTWPLLLPMVKSAVRAMDTAQKYADEQWGIQIKNFTVTGASKRGWTTWLTAAVDKRVNALAPMVIDVLNMDVQMVHQLKTWGKFSEQIEDYTNRGIQQQSATPAGRALTRIVDPFQYRDALTQPKLILLGTNDRYWPLDALNLYWPELKGEKHVLYVPNNGHGLNDFTRVLGSIAAIHRQAAGEIKLADMQWNHANGGPNLELTVEPTEKPAKALAWVANSDTLDFRNATWSSVSLEPAGDGFHHAQRLPAKGFLALFGEAEFKPGGAASMSYFLSTNVKIVGPDGKNPLGR